MYVNAEWYVFGPNYEFRSRERVSQRILDELDAVS